MKALSGTNSDLLTSLPVAGWLFFCFFLATGSIVAFKAKKNGVTFFMLLSSLLTLLSSIGYCGITYKMIQYIQSFALDDVDLNTRLAQLENYRNYIVIAGIVMLSSLLAFAFTFVIYCCNIANIRKRNEQLEILCQQLADRKQGTREKA